MEMGIASHVEQIARDVLGLVIMNAIFVIQESILILKQTLVWPHVVEYTQTMIH